MGNTTLIFCSCDCCLTCIHINIIQVWLLPISECVISIITVLIVQSLHNSSTLPDIWLPQRHMAKILPYYPPLGWAITWGIPGLCFNHISILFSLPHPSQTPDHANFSLSSNRTGDVCYWSWRQTGLKSNQNVIDFWLLLYQPSKIHMKKQNTWINKQ